MLPGVGTVQTIWTTSPLSPVSHDTDPAGCSKGVSSVVQLCPGTLNGPVMSVASVVAVAGSIP